MGSRPSSFALHLTHVLSLQGATAGNVPGVGKSGTAEEVGFAGIDENHGSVIGDTDIGTPGLAATFRAPGIWLIANSRNGRVSRTTALLSARISLSCAVETSAVGCPDSPSVAWKMFPGDCPCAAAATELNNTIVHKTARWFMRVPSL
jgi:hypothetical protein